MVQLADTAGTVTKAYRYDAYGVEKEPDKGDQNPFRYCGEYFDKETGSIYIRARYYEPATSRMLSEDTHWNVNNMIYGKSWNTRNPKINLNAIRQSSNLYVYCMSNLVLFIDSTGNDAIYLTQSDGAQFGPLSAFGHAALALQDENGKWYIMSFVPVGTNEILLYNDIGNHRVTTDVPNVGVVFTELTDIQYGENNRSIISANYNYKGQKATVTGNISKYDSQVYIEGDFTKSITKASEYEKNPPGYWLTGRNCSWLAIDILQASTSGSTNKEIDNMLWSNSLFGKQMNTLIPNMVSGIVKGIFMKEYKVTETKLKP